MVPRDFVVTVCALSTSGCLRRDGRNSECRWPGEASSNSPVIARHLSADAEFAEDLAIRYADTHFLNSGKEISWLAIEMQAAYLFLLGWASLRWLGMR